MADLKPCPFCGGRASLRNNYNTKHRGFYVYAKCDICGAQSKSFFSLEDPAEIQGEEIKAAAEAWNMRKGAQ